VGIFDMLIMDKEKTPEAQSVKKVLISMTFVDNEIEKVIALLENDLYDSMIMYGEEAPNKTANEYPESMTARVMGVYKKVYELVRKLMAYIEHLVLQLHSMINRKNAQFKLLFRYVNYGTMIDLIGRALRAVYVIDCIVTNNGVIGIHWDAYRKMIKLARNEPEKFGTTSLSLKKL
jgi:hypothetical protein